MMMKICRRNYEDNLSAAAAATPHLLFDTDELLCDILSRLPMKSIMWCKSVCKRWLSLITQRDRGFIDLHLARSKATQRRRSSLLITCFLDFETDFYLVEDFLFEEGGEAATAADHLFLTPWNNGNVRYSVNGLLCLVDVDINSVQIFNPSTREITPPIETIFKERQEEVEENGVQIRRRPRFGFGCDSYAKEHKVVCLWEFYRSTTAELQPIGFERVCEVMTVGDNTWRRIDAVPPPYYTHGESVNVDGFIFWRNADPCMWETPDCDALLRFDVASEKFSLIKIPNHVLDGPQPILSSRFIDLYEVDGRIAMLHKDPSVGKFTLWIIDRLDKEDVVVNAAAWNNGTVYTSKWIEETIPMPFDGWNGYQGINFLPVAGTDYIIMEPLVGPRFSPSNSVILYCYDRKKKTSKKVEITGIHSFMVFYPCYYSINLIIESLLPVQNKKQKQKQLISMQFHKDVWGLC